MAAILDYLIYFTYALIGIAAATAVLFPLVYTIRNFSKAKGSLLGVIGLIAIFVVCVSLSKSEVYAKFPEITGAVSKQIEGGLLMFYVMAGLTILSAVYYEVSKLFK